MAAAVCDFKKTSSSYKKIPKNLLINSILKDIEITPDIIKNLSSKKLRGQILLGFAAETGSDKEIKDKGEQKRISKGCEFLMANPIDRKNQGFDENFNSGFLLGPNKMVKNILLSTKLSISHQLLDEIQSYKS
jgi:phosphopantothenoylcysteine decarboxylase/phosphopantothenate--cysteine ligase